MNSAIERLLSLRVTDVMSRNVHEIAANETMTRAAVALASHDVSGAPVVDGEGRCVGILSATDFMRRQADPSVATEADVVGDQMASPVHSILPKATLMDAARRMCGQHVHRLPVVDEEGRLRGLVSSLDLVAAMVQAIEE